MHRAGATRVVVLGCVSVPCISGPAMDSARLSRGHHSAPFKICRLGRGGDWWLAVVSGSPHLWIGAGGLRVLPLIAYGRNAAGVRGGLFLRRGARPCAAFTPVIANPSHVALIHHGRVVHVVNVSDIHVVNRLIVEKAIALPTPAFVTLAELSVAIFD